MDINDLLQFAKKKEVEIQRAFKSRLDDDTRILLQIAKLHEETSELTKEMLRDANFIRVEDKFNSKQRVEEELVDVIVTAMITAVVLDIDIEQVLKRRIPVLSKREC